ncbi:MAG: lipoprotein-releasing ABC transporter permease subunit [Gammaproteobacteria bacterium]|jgi:lipoprotein-releasing system permease protein|nr:lipoprotein-releasing ABC transporter permease subunit [Gammaproteobacteria bacterium]
MFRPYEVFVGLRYLRSRSRNRFVSFIALISVLGIALAVAVLIVVLSVMNGFEYEVRNRILSVVSHGTISGMGGKLVDWEFMQNIARDDPNVLASAPFITGQGMLVGSSAIAGVELRGVDPAAESETSGAARLLTTGSLDTLAPRKYRIVIGAQLAERLRVGPGDNVVLMTPATTVTPAGMLPRMRRFEVSGIFYAGMYEYDRSLAYIHIDDAARMLGYGDAVSGLSLSVADPLNASATVREVALAGGGGVYISDWTRQHANFFRSIELTKAIIFFILLLVVAVAAFNIVSTLVMVVREKSAEIAILRSMGSSARSILWIFLSEGTLIGAAGTLLGLLVGVAVALNIGAIVAFVERLLDIRFVAPDVYFISELPSRLELSDVVQVCLVTFLLAALATIYPALRASGTNPAEALRHE